MKLRDTPCARCGWKYIGFHVCADLSTPCEGEAKRPNRQKEATVEHWRQLRESQSERDEEIVAMYKKGYSYSAIGAEFGLSKFTVGRIMRRAEDNGDVTVRPPGSKPMPIEEVSYGVI